MKFAILALLLATGCKQDVGDRCQVDSDCKDGLVCNQAEQRCKDGNDSGAIDATLPIDAPADAALPDAAIDAL